MNIPEDLRFTKDHEWVKVNGSIGTIGITDYAQGELGDIIYVDITKQGDVKRGEACGTIEAVKTVSDIFSPVSGKIVEVNTSVNDNPAVVNKDPYGEGWMFKIEIKDTNELNALLSPEDYKKLVGE
jgi:glycine cleavage system H protein